MSNETLIKDTLQKIDFSKLSETGKNNVIKIWEIIHHRKNGIWESLVEEILESMDIMAGTIEEDGRGVDILNNGLLNFYD